MNIGRNIQILRKSKGIMQVDLAAHLDRSVRIIQKYEHGDVKPPIDILNKIATYFNITLDELVNKEIPKPVESVTFVEAINSGKNIRSEHWDESLSAFGVFKKLHEYTIDATLKFINGKWYIESEEE